MIKNSKRGSATLVIIVLSVIFGLYASSTYADVRHLKNQYNNIEKNIIKIFEEEYEREVQQL